MFISLSFLEMNFIITLYLFRRNALLITSCMGCKVMNYISYIITSNHYYDYLCYWLVQCISYLSKVGSTLSGQNINLCLIIAKIAEMWFSIRRSIRCMHWRRDFDWLGAWYGFIFFIGTVHYAALFNFCLNSATCDSRFISVLATCIFII